MYQGVTPIFTNRMYGIGVVSIINADIYIQLIGFIICDKSMFTHQTLDTCDKQEKKSHFDVQNKI